jgi:hypothetical protein
MDKESMNRRWLGGIIAIALLVLIGVAGRLMPHPPNLGPIAAIAMFAGFYFRSRLGALTAPLLAMAIADVFIGFYELPTMVVVYFSLAIPVFCRPLLAGRYVALRIGACAMVCSLVFFVLTNLAVWQFGGLYEQSLGGLVSCYGAALPFLKYTLAGDLIWSTALFGTYGLANWVTTYRETSLLRGKSVATYSALSRRQSWPWPKSFAFAFQANENPCSRKT